jgi:hypothetical protein
MFNSTLVSDAMYNCHPRSGSSEEYAEGIIVGLVSAFMANGATFRGAIETIAQHWHTDYSINCIPEVWRDTFASLWAIQRRRNQQYGWQRSTYP